MTTDNLREGGHRGPSFSRRTFAKAAGVSAAALAIGASGASLAWFTGRDVKENKLSIAQNLNIRVVEPAWDPENAKHLVPNQHIPKDPRIENLSDEFSGWMVVEIRVPTAVVSVFDEAEQKVLDPARTPLFSFVADPQWTLLQEFEDGDEDVYRFGWPETIPALGQTPPIFEEVVVANLVEAQGQSGSKTITATGCGIQSEGLPDIATAWEAYKKQNGIGDGNSDRRIVSAVTAGPLLKFVEGVPEVGDTVEDMVIEEVVPDIERLKPQDATPLTSSPEQIEYVDGIVAHNPDNVENWFKDMSQCRQMDLRGLTLQESTQTLGMFDGASALTQVILAPEISPDILPDGFKLNDELRTYLRGEVYAMIVEQESSANTHALVLQRYVAPPRAGQIYAKGGTRRVIQNVQSGVETKQYHANGAYTNSLIPDLTSFYNVVEAEIDCSVKPISTSGWFAGLKSISGIKGLENIDTSSVTDMSYMFGQCRGISSFDMSSFDTRNVEDMTGMFANCSRAKEIILRGCNTEKVKSMSMLFQMTRDYMTGETTALKQLDLTGVDIASVKDFSYMFSGCEKLEALTGLGATPQATDMSYMFENCGSRSLSPLSPFELNLENFDTSKVTTFAGMFSGCSAKSLDLTAFDTAIATDMSYMFSNCPNLEKVEYGGTFKTSSVKTMDSMFRLCRKMNSQAFCGFDTSSVESMSHMFDGYSGGWPASAGVPSLDRLDTTNVRDFSYMFANVNAIGELNINNFDFSNATDVTGMFMNDSQLSSIFVKEGTDLSAVDAEASADMFLDCTALVGCEGTSYDANHVTAEYAKVDRGINEPGYFSL